MAPPPSTDTLPVIGAAVPTPVYNTIMAATGAAFFGLTVYVSARLAGALGRALLYHALVFGAAFGLYMVMPGGFENNFNLPEKKKMTIADVVYYTMVVHSTAGFGDIYPTTFWARTVVSTHLGLVFLVTAGLIKLGGNS